MLRVVRACTERETTELAAYLATTDVSGYAAWLRRGLAVASMAEVDSLDSLGATWSIFGELGGIRVVRRSKFLVREVPDVLRHRWCTDTRSRTRLDDIVAAERAHALIDRRITIAQTVAGAVVVDGNKRACALHEVGTAAEPVPVFVVAAPLGTPPLPLP